MGMLLSLDLSTSATGWAKFDLIDKSLLQSGVIKPQFKNPVRKGVPTYAYPESHVLKLRMLADQVIALLDEKVEKIVIEEINRGKNRLGQKVLDGFHFVLMERMPAKFIPMISFVDSDGKEGWRSAKGLGLQLSKKDRDLNKERKKTNKKIPKGKPKAEVITLKTLSCRFVNAKYNLNLNHENEDTDGDIADAIGLGHFYLFKVLK